MEIFDSLGSEDNMGNKRFVIVAVLLLVATFATFAGMVRAPMIEYSGPEEYRGFINSIFLRYSNVLGTAKVSVIITDSVNDAACDISFGDVRIFMVLLKNSVLYDIEIDGYRDGFIVVDRQNNIYTHMHKNGSYEFIQSPEHVLGMEELSSDTERAIATALHFVLGIDE